MPLHSTCPVLTPIIYNEINFGVHTAYLYIYICYLLKPFLSTPAWRAEGVKLCSA